MKRHSKLLTKAGKLITLACIVLFSAVVALCFIFPDINDTLNGILHSYTPYLLFVMYMINRGTVITQAMFMNCDHSMLTYRFYRQPNAILSLFIERLKYILLINLIPASVIAVGFTSLLFNTGGTDQPINYLLYSTLLFASAL